MFELVLFGLVECLNVCVVESLVEECGSFVVVVVWYCVEFVQCVCERYMDDIGVLYCDYLFLGVVDDCVSCMQIEVCGEYMVECGW